MPAPKVVPPTDANPKVDRDLLTRAAALRQEVEKLGRASDSSYKIAPALGGKVIRQTEGASTDIRRSPFSPVMARTN